LHIRVPHQLFVGRLQFSANVLNQQRGLMHEVTPDTPWWSVAARVR
jgi:hypothetical protein